jgi:hypothetical protein
MTLLFLCAGGWMLLRIGFWFRSIVTTMKPGWDDVSKMSCGGMGC